MSDQPEPFPILCPACATGRRHAPEHRVHHPLLADFIEAEEAKQAASGERFSQPAEGASPSPGPGEPAATVSRKSHA